jgi:hypothetical protein
MCLSLSVQVTEASWCTSSSIRQSVQDASEEKSGGALRPPGVFTLVNRPNGCASRQNKGRLALAAMSGVGPWSSCGGLG